MATVQRIPLLTLSFCTFNYVFVSLCEPVHGSASDYESQRRQNLSEPQAIGNGCHQVWVQELNKAL